MKIKLINIRYYFYIVIVASTIISVIAMTYMPGQSYKGKQPDITKSQMDLSLQFNQQLNQFALKPHNSLHLSELKKTEAYLLGELKKNGFKEINIQKYSEAEFKNIEVVLEPKNKATNTLVIGAHYDSERYSPGADDNGSSVVILLELAKRFQNNFNNLNTRIRIVFFINEEPPFFKGNMMGSSVYANMLYEQKENVIAMYSFDALGYFTEEDNTQNYPYMFKPFYPNKGNFVAFVGNWSSRNLVVNSLEAFRKNAKFPSEGISAWEKIPGIDYSDHTSFYNHNWQAIMVTDTAFNRNKNYHTENDNIDSLNFLKMAQLTDELETMFRTLYENK